jgi:hypothetical protein
VVTAVDLVVRKAVAIAAATAEVEIAAHRKVAGIAEEDLAAHHPAGAIAAEETRPHQTAMDATVNLLDAGWRPAFSPRSPSGGFARSLLLSWMVNERDENFFMAGII